MLLAGVSLFSHSSTTPGQGTSPVIYLNSKDAQEIHGQTEYDSSWYLISGSSIVFHVVVPSTATYHLTIAAQLDFGQDYGESVDVSVNGGPAITLRTQNIDNCSVDCQNHYDGPAITVQLQAGENTIQLSHETGWNTDRCSLANHSGCTTVIGIQLYQ